MDSEKSRALSYPNISVKSCNAVISYHSQRKDQPLRMFSRHYVSSNKNRFIVNSFSFRWILFDPLNYVRMLSLKFSNISRWSTPSMHFQSSILPLLQEAHAKIHLVNPSNPLLQIVGEHLDPRQIVSLRINEDFRISPHDLPIFRTFVQLTTVTLLTRWGTHRIDDLRRSSPNVRRLSIWFNNEIN